MQADLVALAIEHGSAVLADHLKASARQHGSARLTAVILKMVEQAAQLAAAKPAVGHGVGMWFRPIIARHLKAVGIGTLADLIDFCNRRGGSWWRAVPRIGAGRARHVIAWLCRHEQTLGKRVVVEVDLADPLRAPDDKLVLVDIGGTVLVPLERMRVGQALSGVDGVNRAQTFPYIAARHDLDAVLGYLHQYRDQPKTLRAYTKELERFLLWCIRVRGKALSSMLVDDCEAYKDFLSAPIPAFVGPRAQRASGRWLPFASSNLSAESRRYAVRALRAAFAWLVDVRYLDGNPWKAVKDPPVVEREVPIQVGRAIPGDLWEEMRAQIDRAASKPDATRWRTVRAMLLLMGDSGLRRDEAARARRESLVESQYDSEDEDIRLWELQIVGKRSRERTVAVSPNAIDALRAHWIDRGRDFDAPNAQGPLIAPTVIPRTPQALKKHGLDPASVAAAGGTKGMTTPDADLPYSTDVFNQLVDWAREKLVAEMSDLRPEVARRLAGISPHAFRHTFGTQAAANNVPVDVIQRAMGHASLGTTTIYTQPEKRRMMRELGRLYSRRREDGGSSNNGE
ncbi:phage integrase family protein [Trinickia mobilis]|uniref:phage integrase family protein n=1 Tax=Trinickia mobilis TaxID=2816356 RepID=UPI002867C946|nr:phage integrase family protein [Trinickia mobilis]